MLQDVSKPALPSLTLLTADASAKTVKFQTTDAPSDIEPFLSVLGIASRSAVHARKNRQTATYWVNSAVRTSPNLQLLRLLLSLGILLRPLSISNADLPNATRSEIDEWIILKIVSKMRVKMKPT